MKRLNTFICVLLLSCQMLFAKSGYRIDIKIDNFAGKEIILGHYSADKQFVDDTVTINLKNVFVLEGKEKLKGGIYLVLMPPDNRYFQLLIDEEQHFSTTVDAKDPIASATFKDSRTNVLFYEYLRFLDQRRKQAEALKTKGLPDGELQTAMQKLSEEVKQYQLDVVKKNPNSINAMLLKANINVDIPEALMKDEMKRYLFFKQHYFDNINLQDDRLFRTPFIYEKLEYYVEKLTPQHPDSINVSLNRILNAMKPETDLFKFYVSHFLNKYAKSNIVGFDAVYVHLVENYYAKGLTPWVEKEQLEKIIDNAQILKPILIGKTAPNVTFFSIDKTQTFQLHDIKSPFIILYFWDPDCGHCKKSMPNIKQFNAKFKEKGVKVVAVCGKSLQDEKKCTDSIKEYELGDIWLNVWDPYIRYKVAYDVRTTPQIFVLDKDKTIISKRIGVEQLEEVMDRLIEQEQKKGSSK